MTSKSRQKQSVLREAIVVVILISEGLRGWLSTKEGHEGTLWGSGNVPYLDLGGGYAGIKNSPICTLRISAFYVL